MFLGLVCLILPWMLFAHQSAFTPDGNELVWTQSTIPLTIKTNTSDISSSNVISVIQKSISQWNAGSPVTIYPTSNASNEIRFVSDFPYGSGVVGITEVSYSNSGNIQRAVISLNDDYTFHATEGSYASPHFYLGDVVTHEMGHLLGMAHSEVLSASMFYATFPGQNTVALDDVTGHKHKYSGPGGRIHGVVKGGKNIGVLGVHVQAISRRTGEAVSTVTDETGAFDLRSLPYNDTYYIYTSPTKKVESLPKTYSNTQTQFCPASYVGSFYSSCGRENDGKPTAINVTDFHNAHDVGTVTINCSLRADENYSLQKLQSTFTPVTILDYQKEQRSEKSFVGWFRKPTTFSWTPYDVFRIDLTSYNELSGNPKYLKASLVSYPFGNQLEYEMVIKQNDLVVTSANRSLIGPMVNGTYNTDFEAFVPLNTTSTVNNYEIDIRARKLSAYLTSQTFPAYNDFTSGEHMPYLLIVSLWEMTPQGMQPIMDAPLNLSDNEDCLDAPFTFAVTQTQGGESSTATNEDRDQTMANGTCGTIEPPSNGPTSSLPILMLGFLLSFLLRRKKFLS